MIRFITVHQDWLSVSVLVYWVGFGCNLSSGTGDAFGYAKRNRLARRKPNRSYQQLLMPCINRRLESPLIKVYFSFVQG
ncbi:MAG: hypothetical protein ACRC80_12310 [Waterburya sp.]